MSIEDVKRYWDERPCNLRHSQKPIGTEEYFNEVEEKKYFVEPHILSFAQFDTWKEKKVLEIGCGQGTAVTSFARAGAHVTAIDISTKSLEMAKQRMQVFQLEAMLYEGNAEVLETIIPVPQMEEDKFDLIYSFGVIHHSPNPRAIIAQLSQFLKKTGELRIMLYSLYSYKAFDFMQQTNTRDMGKLREVIRHYSEAQTGSPVTFVYSFDEIETLLAPYFKVEKMWKDHVFSWDVEEYKKGNYVKSEAFRNITHEDFKVLEKELGWHTLVVAHKI